jgi:hypothetical protein
MRSNGTTVLLAAICMVSSGLLALLVASGQGALLPLTLYAVALGSVIAIVYRIAPTAKPDRSRSALNWVDLGAIGGLMAMQLAGLLYMLRFPYHYVQDEFITGYTSYTLGPIPEVHWFAGYPEPGAWIAQFPILYYALQVPFIAVLGLSLETVRISTWPYHLLTVALVYLIGREMLPGRVWAAVAGLLYIFLAPNLYMAGYGMHNISSAFFFVAALYCAIRMVSGDNRWWLVACGLFATMAYLTYTSSYLTIPLLVLFIVLAALARRTWVPIRQFGMVLFIVAVGLLPFVVHALTQANYFIQRGDQVNAIERLFGEDSSNEIDASPAEQFIEHVQTNLRALYYPGIGGVTDYWFGKQALFDPLTLGLIIAGLVTGLFYGWRERQVIAPVAVATVLATFVFGMFLTLPAGGFHRTTLAFPFLALLIALVLLLLWQFTARLVRKPHLRHAAPSTLIALFILINLHSLHTMVREDESISTLTDSVPIVEFIETELALGKQVLISAFHNYHLEREIVVRTGDVYPVDLVSFDEALQQAEHDVVILFRPNDEQISRLNDMYPSGRIIDSVMGTDLRRHKIYVPARLEEDRAIYQSERPR